MLDEKRHSQLARRAFAYRRRDMKPAPQPRWLLASMLLLAACGSSSKSSPDDTTLPSTSTSTSTSTSSSKPAASSSSTASAPNCKVDGASYQLLPSDQVASIRVLGGSIYYYDQAGVSKVAEGDTKGAGAQTLLAGAFWLYVNDSEVGTFARHDGDSNGDVVLFQASGGSPVRQPATNVSVMGNYRYAGKQSKLFGSTSFLPFSYYSHDIATGQEQNIETQLRVPALGDLLATADALYVNSSGYEATDKTDLYRIDTKGGDPVAIDTGIPVRFQTVGVDAKHLYLFVRDEDGVGTFGPALYAVPVAGGPAVAVPLRVRDLINSVLLPTDAGMFLYQYDGIDNKLYRLDTSTDAAASLGQPLVLDCRLGVAWSTADSFYVTIDDIGSTEGTWLMKMPLSQLP